VEGDIENLRFNTAISAMMIFLNLAVKKGKVTRETVNIFIKILSPFAPHLAEELWRIQGHDRSIAHEPWPEVNEELLKEDIIEYPVSFNGKLRFTIELRANLDKDEITKRVLGDERARKWLDTGTVVKIIVVPQRIVNIVLKK
jgi:leucyl-tRNA synthetase